MSANPSRTMKDVSHTPPSGEPVSGVWERGREATTEE
jgi:hypothetical protein